MHDDVALIELGHELGAEAHGADDGDGNERDCPADDEPAHAQSQIQQRLVEPARSGHDLATPLGHSTSEEQRDAGWHERDRQDHRAHERDDDRRCHRVEHLSLDTRQRKDRYVDGRDDADTEQGGTNDLARRIEHELESLGQAELAFGVLLREPPQAVLDDDDGAVDDEPEIERPQTHEVRTDAALHHARDRHEHRDRNHGRRQQRRTHVAHEQKQHDDDEQRALGQIRAHGHECLIDELGAVVNGRCRHAVGQRILQDLERLGDTVGDFATVLADEHEYRAHDNLATVLRGCASAQLAPYTDVCEIRNAQRHAVLRRDDDILDIVEILSLPGDTHEPLRPVVLDETRAAVVVVRTQCRGKVVVTEPVGQQLARVRRYKNFLLKATDRIDLDNPWHAQQLRTDDPVVHGAQLRLIDRRAIG